MTHIFKIPPHFQRVSDKVNKGPELQTNAMLVTADVEGAYLNIPHEDGNNFINEALEERNDKSIPSSFLVKLLDLIKIIIYLNSMIASYGSNWSE